MKVINFDWEVDDDNVATLRCPICDTPWVTDNEGDYTHQECEHLRFIWSDNGPEYVGKWEKDPFEEKYFKALMEKWEEPIEQIPGSPDFDILKSLDIPEITEILFVVEEGLACGPVSITTAFGIYFK
jgi:hypothetical protein